MLVALQNLPLQQLFFLMASFRAKKRVCFCMRCLQMFAFSFLPLICPPGPCCSAGHGWSWTQSSQTARCTVTWPSSPSPCPPKHAHTHAHTHTHTHTHTHEAFQFLPNQKHMDFVIRNRSQIPFNPPECVLTCCFNSFIHSGAGSVAVVAHKC